MSILNKIKEDQLTARKAKDSGLATLLTTLYSEAANVGLDDGKRESTDVEVIAVIRKFIKNSEEIVNASRVEEVMVKAMWEQAELTQYLPKQISEAEMVDIIRSLTAFGNSGRHTLGSLMDHFKTLYPGLYDGKVLSGFVRARLAVIAAEASLAESAIAVSSF